MLYILPYTSKLTFSSTNALLNSTSNDINIKSNNKITIKKQYSQSIYHSQQAYEHVDMHSRLALQSRTVWSVQIANRCKQRATIFKQKARYMSCFSIA